MIIGMFVLSILIRITHYFIENKFLDAVSDADIMLNELKLLHIFGTYCVICCAIFITLHIVLRLPD